MAIAPEAMRETIKAVVVVQATPLNRDNSLDLNGLKANTRFLVERCAGKRIVERCRSWNATQATN